MSTVSVRLTGEYAVWQEGTRSAAVTLGNGYDQIDFADHQERLANQVHVDDGPLLVAGMRVAF